MSRSVLIAGASGFVGAVVARRALLAGHGVHLILRTESKLWRLEDVLPEMRVHTGAIEDAEFVDETVAAARPDWVFNLAAHGAYSNQTRTRPMIRTNVEGTVNLLEACSRHGVHRFVQTGSSSEYGLKAGPVRED